MTQYKCDKCGKIILFKIELKTLVMTEKDKNDYAFSIPHTDLCLACIDDLKDWLKPKVMEPKNS